MQEQTYQKSPLILRKCPGLLEKILAEGKIMSYRCLVSLFILFFMTVIWGCGSKDTTGLDHREKKVDEQVREKYGKSFAELPVVKLVAISPHNVDIEKEYETAFSIYHAVHYGQRIQIEWRDVGGGSTAILSHLRNVYANSDRSGIDIAWGGGEYNFQVMAEEGILEKMKIDQEVLQQIPTVFSGLEMYDKDKRWCGSAISGFGFLYNKQLFERMKLKKPEKWEDLGTARFYGLVGLADPSQSGSAAASYEMIVQSGETWEKGWAKLLNILGNVKRFYAGAGDAAEAIPSGEVAISTCIDFYGINRVSKYPDTLVYMSPKGQTAFNPDPIAILKNPPHPELAQRMVDFVLSLPGQALWALPVGHPDGPLRAALCRQPIRKDVYTTYAGELSPMTINPFAEGQGMTVDNELWSISYGVLRQLVWAAAVENLDGLKSAKKKLIETNFPTDRMGVFNALPDNIASRQKLQEMDRQLRDTKQRDIIATEWITYFRDKYKRVSE